MVIQTIDVPSCLISSLSLGVVELFRRLPELAIAGKIGLWQSGHDS